MNEQGLTTKELKELKDQLNETESFLLRQKIDLMTAINITVIKNILVRKGICTEREYTDEYDFVKNNIPDFKEEYNRIKDDLDYIQHQQKCANAIEKALNSEALTEDETDMIQDILKEYGEGINTNNEY